MADSLAKAYALALFEIAADEGKCEEYRQIIHELKETFDQKFVQLLSHPKISRKEKKACIDKVYGKSLDPVFIHFLKVLIDKNRFQYATAICDEFDQKYIEYFNIVQAFVYSACKLSEDERQRLEIKLKNKYQCPIECYYQVDPSLIAGIKVVIQDEVMDNTAINRLNKMKEHINVKVR